MRRCLLVILIVALASPSWSQQAPNTTTHVVKPGDTLNALARRYLGDSRRWPEIHRLNPQLRNPNALTPGERLTIPLDIQAGSAVVADLARRVERKPVPEPWTPASRGDELHERDGIRTYAESSARLTFEDGADLILSEDSLVFLQAIERRKRGRGRDVIEIVDGQADIRSREIRRDSAEIEVIIGSSTVKPKARKGQLETRGRITAEQTAQVMAYEGETSVAAAGSTVELRQGMGTVIVEGRPPTRPEKLLPAPALTAPASDEVVLAPRLIWQPVRSAESYTVEVCHDRECNELQSRLTGLGETSIEVDPPAGKWFWRVTAASASGLDGYPSEPRVLVRGIALSGRLLRDPNGDAKLDDAEPVAGVVRLLAAPTDPAETNPRILAQTRADEDGVWQLPAAAPGSYWVSVDARSLASMALTQEVWMEQTHGPAGALCAAGSGHVRRADPGPCYGGRSAHGTAHEHVAVVEAGEAPISGLDFAFSENVVTHAADPKEAGGSADQGSLRRFITNANHSPGPNAMRFVPVTTADSTTPNGASWWRIELAAPLPVIVDEGTEIDGQAWAASGQRRDSNPGLLGERDGESHSGIRPPAPELLVVGTGSDPVFELERRGAIRHLALDRGTPLVRVHADQADLTGVLFGVLPDGTPGERSAATAVESSAELRLSESVFVDSVDPVLRSGVGPAGCASALLPAPRLLAANWQAGAVVVRGLTCRGSRVQPYVELNGVMTPLAPIDPEEDGSFRIEIEDVGPLQAIGFVAFTPAGSSPMSRTR